MDADELFEFSSSYLAISCFSLFEEMKQNEELCDITIKVRNQNFAAHRIILSAAFPYFRAMFRSRMQESTEKEISMEEADPEALRCLISFAYTGKLKIHGCKVQSLLETALYLQLNPVTDACFTYLVKHLNQDNVLSLRTFAEGANHMNTVELTDRFIRENFDDVSMTAGFLDLPLSVLKALIRRDDLNVTSEEVVFEAVIKWVKASEGDRRVFLMELLQNIRMSCLTPEYLNRVCSTDEFIKTLPFRNMLDEVKNHLAKCLESPFNFSLPERYCKEKHHLKCQKKMGCGMYSIIRGTFSNSPRLLDYLLNHSLYYYEPIKEEWVALSDVKEIGSFSYIICIEEKIYLVRTGLIHTFHLKTLKSTSLKCKSCIPSGGRIVLHKCSAYIFGGGKDFSKDVHYFDPQQGACFKVGEMITCRSEMGVASLGDYIYITGGKNPCDKTILRSVERYDPSLDVSTEIAPLNVPRSGHGCVSHEGKIYVCGGRGSDSAEVYDPDVGQWEMLPSMNKGKSDLSLISYAGKLYAVGISDPLKDSKDVEIYDLQSGSWKCGKSVPFIHVRIVVTNSATTLKFLGDPR